MHKRTHKYSYDNGGNSTPQVPTAIANDPMFQGVRYVGKAKDHYVRKVAGQGADFRYDGKGLKFYGYNDDGLYIEDKDGNLFVAERRVGVPGDPEVKKKLQDPNLTGREKMMLEQRLMETQYMDLFDHIEKEYGGKFSDEHDMTQEGASYDDHNAFGPSDTGELLHNLSMVGSRQGDPSGDIIAGPSAEERRRVAREHDRKTDYGMKTARSYMMGGNTGSPVDDMKKKIIQAMEGGASDREIMMMVNESPLSKDYEFNWDNVQMQVEVYPLKKDKAPAIDPMGRGYGGPGSSKTEDMLERLSDMGRGRKAGRGRTYAY
jgi:hypothetical protein